MKTILVTGSAGFIGFHMAQKLLDSKYHVVGIDNLNNYYDHKLKQCRQDMLQRYDEFTSYNVDLNEPGFLHDIFAKYNPTHVVHLAAQAGVRASLENPRAYIENNLLATFELLEAAVKHPPEHLLLASTSSAYGANTHFPYTENTRSDWPVSFYAATKKSTEVIAHSYAHIHQIPTTMFRFFTVYGPWGRPDMAPIKFSQKIMNGDEIEIYNHGDLQRDFTYVGDVVEALRKLIESSSAIWIKRYEHDSLSPVAPFRVLNIGCSKPVELMEFIRKLEKHLGKTAIKKYVDMQPGDVKKTWADVSLLRSLTGFEPQVDLDTGLKAFANWYKNYYGTYPHNR